MFACKTLVHTSLFPFVVQCRIRGSTFGISGNPSSLCAGSRGRSICLSPSFLGLGSDGRALAPLRSYSSSMEVAVDPLDDVSRSSEDTVEEMLVKGDRVDRLMKMERRSEANDEGTRRRWFPYLDVFRSGSVSLTSHEVVEVLDPYILEVRKEKMRSVVRNRSYSVCLVVEGLTDFGNVSAAFRSADALGIQSVHVISSENSSKRYRDNRHVSMGAEKWLDIELWRSPTECFMALKLRGYRIATTHLATDAVSIYDMDWSCPTAIVVGNEHRGISDESLRLSDLHCSIPMSGMVDSFNVSVAAGILMHHAVSDRVSHLNRHGDLTSEESQILLAEFFLRHRESTVCIIQEYAKRYVGKPLSKL